jgi:hypothetical protein
LVFVGKGPTRGERGLTGNWRNHFLLFIYFHDVLARHNFLVWTTKPVLGLHRFGHSVFPDPEILVCKRQEGCSDEAPKPEHAADLNKNAPYDRVHSNGTTPSSMLDLPPPSIPSWKPPNLDTPSTPAIEQPGFNRRHWHISRSKAKVPDSACLAQFLFVTDTWSRPSPVRLPLRAEGTGSGMLAKSADSPIRWLASGRRCSSELEVRDKPVFPGGPPSLAEWPTERLSYPHHALLLWPGEGVRRRRYRLRRVRLEANGTRIFPPICAVTLMRGCTVTATLHSEPRALAWRGDRQTSTTPCLSQKESAQIFIYVLYRESMNESSSPTVPCQLNLTIASLDAREREQPQEG